MHRAVSREAPREGRRGPAPGGVDALSRGKSEWPMGRDGLASGRFEVPLMVRNKADWRTVLWAFVFFPVVGFAPYVEPRVIPWILPVSLYFGFCAGVFTHNQNHCPTFKTKGM